MRFVIGMFLIAGCAHTQPTSSSTSQNAPTIAPDADGRRTLLVFWASWCDPCNKEAAALVRLAREQREHLRVVSVSVDQKWPDAQAFMNRHKLPYRVIHDPELALSDHYGVSATPTLLLMDSSGGVLGRATRLGALQAAITAEVQR